MISRKRRCHDEAFVIHADMKLSPVSTMGDVVFYIESRRFLIRDSPRPATTYEQKTGGADGVKGA